jgi:hypothetical protein
MIEHDVGDEPLRRIVRRDVCRETDLAVRHIAREVKQQVGDGIADEGGRGPGRIERAAERGLRLGKLGEGRLVFTEIDGDRLHRGLQRLAVQHEAIAIGDQPAEPQRLAAEGRRIDPVDRRAVFLAAQHEGDVRRGGTSLSGVGQGLGIGERRRHADVKAHAALQALDMDDAQGCPQAEVRRRDAAVEGGKEGPQDEQAEKSSQRRVRAHACHLASCSGPRRKLSSMGVASPRVRVAMAMLSCHSLSACASSQAAKDGSLRRVPRRPPTK